MSFYYICRLNKQVNFINRKIINIKIDNYEYAYIIPVHQFLWNKLIYFHVYLCIFIFFLVAIHTWSTLCWSEKLDSGQGDKHWLICLWNIVVHHQHIERCWTLTLTEDDATLSVSKITAVCPRLDRGKKGEVGLVGAESSVEHLNVSVCPILSADGDWHICVET